MKHQHITTLVVASVFVVSVAVTGQDRFAVRSPNGIAFSEFKGYDAWQLIAPSEADVALGCISAPCVKAILGNATMIKALNDGIPANGKPVPDGAAMAKVEWARKSNSSSPYAVSIPGALNGISFMVKDSKRFPDTNGWGYATFAYDASSDTFKPSTTNPLSARACHGCHIGGAKAHDFVYTSYAKR